MYMCTCTLHTVTQYIYTEGHLQGCMHMYQLYTCVAPCLVKAFYAVIFIAQHVYTLYPYYFNPCRAHCMLIPLDIMGMCMYMYNVYIHMYMYMIS